MLAEEIFRPYELSIPGNYCSRSWTSATDQRLAAILPARMLAVAGWKIPWASAASRGEKLGHSASGYWVTDGVIFQID